jgi:predicted nucleic-acid-binding protein
VTGLDTNILVRYLVQDDEEQFKLVLRLLNRSKTTFFLCDVVLVETSWVLRNLYGWSGNDVADAIARLIRIQNLVFESEDRVRSSIKAVRGGADLADELIVRFCRDLGTKDLCTFDKGVVSRHKPFARFP